MTYEVFVVEYLENRNDEKSYCKKTFDTLTKAINFLKKLRKNNESYYILSKRIDYV